MNVQSKAHRAAPLAGTGVLHATTVHANLTASALVPHAIRRNEGTLSEDGAFIAITGVHTGRSVKDKFVVDEASVSADVDWGKVNHPGFVCWGRSRAPHSRSGGHHRGLERAVRAQHVHPPD